MAATSYVPDRQQRAQPRDARDRWVARSASRIGRDPAEPTLFGAEAADDALLRPDLARMRASRQIRRKELPWLRIGLASAAVIAALAYVAQTNERDGGDTAGTPVPQASLIAPPPPWQPVVRPAPFYAVQGSDGKAMPAMVDVRRHVSGGREDTLTFGVFGEAGYARLSVTRGTAELESGRFFVDLVRRAASAGLSVARSGQTEAVATKFGAVEAASVTLADTTEQPCLAFRFAHADTSFGFQGWLCGSDSVSVATGQLACFLDRLALVAADDQPLRAVFAQSDRRRIEACAPVPRDRRS
jgi:hypothetical protein